MTISVHRLSYLCISTVAETNPVWAAQAGIAPLQGLGTIRADVATLTSLRTEIQSSSAGDATERSLLMGFIDDVLAQESLGILRRDPAVWIERVAAGIDVAGDEDVRSILDDVPRFISACFDDASRFDARLVARAEVMAGDLARFARALGSATAATSLEESSASWREKTGGGGVLGRAGYERLFRAAHRLWYPAAELHALAVDELQAAKKATTSPEHSSIEELARAADGAVGRASFPLAPLHVRASLPERPAWLSPYRPFRPLAPSSPAILHPSTLPVKEAVTRFVVPGEHALRSAARKQRTDLRKVYAAPATISGWRAFVSEIYGDGSGRIESAALAAADTAIHGGIWDFEEAIEQLHSLTRMPTARCEAIATEALARPAISSASFVGHQELKALASGVRPDVFVAAVLTAGSLPIPFVADHVTKVLEDLSSSP